MEELQFIVEKLNEPPFNAALTLVAFDEKTPKQLLQVVNDVFAELDESHRIDLRDEDDADTQYRIIDFVMMINYKDSEHLPKEQLHDRIISGDRDVVYPFLAWMLGRIPELKTRAYLARFLRRLEIPSDILASDAGIQSSNDELRQLQSQFMETHKAVAKLRSSKSDPGATRKKIEQLKHEKKQLQTRLSRMRSKIDGEAKFQNVDFDAILTQTSALRTIQEEQVRLFQRLQEQKHLKMRSESKYAVLHRRLREMKDVETHQVDSSAILTRLRSEIQMTRRMLENKVDVDMREVSKSVDELEGILLQEPMNQEQVDDLQHNIERLKLDIDVLFDTQRKLFEKTDDKLRFFRNQASATQRKKETVIESAEVLQREKNELTKDLRELENELGFTDLSKPRTEADIKRYMKELQEKTQVYKQCKTNLQNTRNEIAVLQRTEEILRSRDENLPELLAELKRNNGVSGYLHAQNTLEKVSIEKSTVDVSKGATLEEMSAVVNQLITQLNNKKGELAPKIKALRDLRNTFKQAESRYLETKRTWDNISVGLENTRMELEDNLNEVSTGYSCKESQYHLLNSLMVIEGARHARLERENVLQNSDGGTKKNSISVPEKYESFRSMFETETRKLEERSRELRKQQKELKTTHHANVRQREQFSSLRILLQQKLHLFEQQPDGEDAQHNFLKLAETVE